MDKSLVEAATADIDAGRVALKQGDWRRARACFEAAIVGQRSGEAYEGLGRAAYWLDDLPATFGAYEQSFQLYRVADDAVGAARVAIQLSVAYVDFQEEFAIGNGWIQRAASLLRDLEPCAEQGWLGFYQMLFAVELDGNFAAARVIGEQTLVLARQLGIFDLEMLAEAGLGYVQVRNGMVREGIQRLDEATAAALGGEINDLSAVGATCCVLIFACEAVGDFERAAQWSLRAREFCRRWGLVSFFSVCRVYYATVLIWRGQWEEAEAELASVSENLLTPRLSVTSLSICRLAELRRRQGRFDEARALFSQVEGHHLALLGRAAMAFDEGDLAAVPDLIERYLRRSSDEDRAERVFALSLLLRAQLILGQRAAADSTLGLLEAQANLTSTWVVDATASQSRGHMAVADGDTTAARRHFEDAVDLFQKAGTPFEVALARLDLSSVLSEAEQVGAARREARLAFESLRQLGARREADRALATLRQLEDEPAAELVGGQQGFSRREAEVVALLIKGRSNQEIAAELVISVRTVERHISSIYEKVGVHGASARAALAARLLGGQASAP